MFELNIKATQCHERVRPVLYAQMGDHGGRKVVHACDSYLISY